MAVRRGSATPSKIYRGTVPVSKIYRGNTLVWSAGPYPTAGSWSGTIPEIAATQAQKTWASHLLVESGTFAIAATVTAPINHIVSVYVNGNSNNTLFEQFGDGAITGSATATFPAGTRLDFITYGMTSGPGTGTWSIVKN